MAFGVAFLHARVGTGGRGPRGGGRGSGFTAIVLMTLAAQNKALFHRFTTVMAAHGRGSDSCGLPNGAWHGMMEPFLNRIELESKEDT